jgi:hypothetical protein
MGITGIVGGVNCVGCGFEIARQAVAMALCRQCAQDVAPCEGLIPDHVRSRVDPAEGAAWIVDGFGAAHPISARTTIGRSVDGDLVVLAASVSRAHAELRHAGTYWTVRDLGSRNGTFVDGAPCNDQTVLARRALLKLGDVALWFLTELAHQPPPRLALTVTGGGVSRMICYDLIHQTTELRIFAPTDSDTSGGALLWRPIGSEPWSERSLAPLEFQLLRSLCVRAATEAALPSPVRGCVATKQLVRDLPFQSKYANQDNVRQVVLRLRGLFAEVGARDLVAVAPGRGYYLACQVSAGSRRRPVPPRVEL